MGIEDASSKKKSPGELKALEYSQRIRDGEDKVKTLEGLGPAFRASIERYLAEELEGKANRTSQGEITNLAKIQEIKGSLGITETRNESISATIEERKKLSGWPASFELAKIAMQKNIDLTSLTREDYAKFAVENSLAIEDDQLRVAPWQRMATSAEDIVAQMKKIRAEIAPDTEKTFARFSFEMIQKASGQERFLSEDIRIRQGTKDSNSWLFFGIGKGTSENSTETHKSYISLKNLNTLTPAKLISFMKVLRDSGYNGDVKIFQDLSEQGTRLNDQIVMHGASQADAERALQIADTFWGEELDQKSTGKDEIIDGKNMSYSQILAMRIKKGIETGQFTTS